MSTFLFSAKGGASELSVANFYSILGLSETDLAGHKVKPLKQAVIPRMMNFLIINHLDTTTRTILYSQQSCGARAFQFMSLSNEKSAEQLIVLYPCDNQCLGTSEAITPDPKSIASTIKLPKSYCSLLWGGSINIDDVNGL